MHHVETRGVTQAPAVPKRTSKAPDDRKLLGPTNHHGSLGFTYPVQWSPIPQTSPSFIYSQWKTRSY